jgi:uncharacterized membrane protein YoaT (DUF817 family)
MKLNVNYMCYLTHHYLIDLVWLLCLDNSLWYK